MKVLQQSVFGQCRPEESSAWWIDMNLRRLKDSFLRSHVDIFCKELLDLEWKKVLLAAILEVRAFTLYQEGVKESWVDLLPYVECWVNPSCDVFKSTMIKSSLILSDLREVFGNLMDPTFIVHSNILLQNLKICPNKSSMADYNLRNSILSYIEDLEKALDNDIIRPRFFPGLDRPEANLILARINVLKTAGHLKY